MTAADRWRWGGPAHASAVRTAVLGIWLVIAAGVPYPTFARLPQGLIEPHGAVRLLLATPALKAFFFSAPVLMALKWGAVAGCLMGIFRPRRPPWVLPATAACVLTLDLFTKALDGYASHPQIVPLLVLLVVAALDTRRDAPARSVSLVWLASLMIVVPYTYIAINRLRLGGPALFLGDALLQDIAMTSRFYSTYHFTFFLDLIRIPAVGVLLKAGFGVITFFELTSVAILFSRPYRIAWLLVIVPFHFMTLFSMNIFFWENLVLALVIFGWGVWRPDATLARAPAELAPAENALATWR